MRFPGPRSTPSRQRGSALLAAMVIVLLIATAMLAAQGRRFAARGSARRAWMNTAARVLARSCTETVAASGRGFGRDGIDLGGAVGSLTVTVREGEVRCHAVVEPAGGRAKVEADVELRVTRVGGGLRITEYVER